MNKLQMQVLVRDITVGEDLAVVLPVPDIFKDTRILREHEYIILEHDGTLPAEELTSLSRLNDLLIVADDAGMSKQGLSVLSKTYLWPEMIQIIENESAVIVDFTAETADWNSGHGGNEDDDDFGRLLYDQGYSFLPCEVPEDLEDYITWFQNWFSAESSGWRKVKVGSNCYLVNGGL